MKQLIEQLYYENLDLHKIIQFIHWNRLCPVYLYQKHIRNLYTIFTSNQSNSKVLYFHLDKLNILPIYHLLATFDTKDKLIIEFIQNEKYIDIPYKKYRNNVKLTIKFIKWFSKKNNFKCIECNDKIIYKYDEEHIICIRKIESLLNGSPLLFSLGFRYYDDELNLNILQSKFELDNLLTSKIDIIKFIENIHDIDNNEKIIVKEIYDKFYNNKFYDFINAIFDLPFYYKIGNTIGEIINKLNLYYMFQYQKIRYIII